MSEAEIRELEVNAAKAMGWGQLVYSSFVGGITHLWTAPEGSKLRSCEDYPPQFARDPEAILEALTWLLTQRITLYEDPSNGYWVEWEDDKTRSTHAETIGIAICRAICRIGATCQTSEGEK